MNFVHLHTKSEYSILRSTIRTKNLLDKAQSLGMPAVALTDRNNLFGAIEFSTGVKPSLEQPSQGEIKPILGMELSLPSFFSSDHHQFPAAEMPVFNLVLLAINLKGYHQLIKLTTQAYQNNSDRPWVEWKDFEAYQSDCIVLSGGTESELFSLIAQEKIDQAIKLASYFRDLCSNRYYLEIHNHEYELEQKVVREIITLGNRLNLPLVATNEVCYLERKDWISYEVLHAIGTKDQIDVKGQTIDRKKSNYLPGINYHFKTYEEMLASFSDLPESLSNTLSIAERCEWFLKGESNQIHMPVFPLPEAYRHRTADDFLREESFRRLERKLGSLDESYSKRLQYELEIIKKMDFSSYFIIVADFIDFAKKKNILVGGGRGSAAGSLVSYAMGITSLDPIEYGLYFERFLNPERVSFPDIDIDFEDQRRGEVIDYVKQFYGKTHVSHIVTFGKLKAKAVFKDVARVFKINFERANEFSSFLKEAKESEKTKKGKKSLLQFRYEEDVTFATHINNDPTLQLVYEQSLKLENLTRQIGIHAAGVVISDKPLSDYIPLAQTSDGTLVTQYDKDLLEPYCGLIKMDFLGIKMLSVIQESTAKAEQVYGVKVDIETPPLNDPKAFDLFANELTAGIFQFSSVGMKRYLKDLRPESIQELIAMNAIYRPGPMAWIPVYIAERRGRKTKFNDLDDEKSFFRFKKICEDYSPLKDILSETSLIPIYQEQIMEICRVYAGFSLGKSDNVRKAMGKKDQKLIDQLRKSFIDGAVGKGHLNSDAIFVYDQFVVPFGGYGFNKSHSACYAFLAYQTAYLKGNYPLAFMPALLNAELLANHTGNIQEYIHECSVMKIEVMAPDINSSGTDFQVKSQFIIYGLAAIKNVGWSAAENIVSERVKNGRYKNMGDFLIRHRQEKINKQAVESLVKAGAFDSLGIPSDILFAKLEVLAERVRKERELLAQGQMSFFELPGDEAQVKSSKEYLYEDLLKEMRGISSFSGRKKELEKEALGFNLRYNPMINYRNLFEKATDFDTLDSRAWKNGRAQLAGVVQSANLFYTKKDSKEMVRWEVNDGKTNLSLISLPNHWEKIKADLIAQENRFTENHSSNQLVEHLKDQVARFRIVIRDDHFNQSGKKVLILDEMTLIDQDEARPQEKSSSDLWIEIDGNDYFDTAQMDQIIEILSRYRGRHKVYWVLKARDRKDVFPTPFQVAISDAFKLELGESKLIKRIRLVNPDA